MLNLSKKGLNSLPTEIGRLQNLIVLNLRHNNLQSLPSEIGQFQSLLSLDLLGNQLQVLPPEIGQLKNLQSLDLITNHLQALPSEIGQLQNLKLFYLAGNQLQALPSEIGQLQNLKLFHLADNRLQALPSEIGQLQNLQSLELWDNQLQALPSEIGQLQNLQSLNLSGNQLQALPSEIGQLQNLRSLNLSSNRLQSLPPEIGQLQNLRSLNLSGNPWRTPFNHMSQGSLPELLAYLRSLQDAVPIYEAKVLLVGEGAVGKSSLLAALRGERFVENRSSTHGIELHTVETEHPEHGETEALRLNFWDFGGQEVYRVTHQFFFSPDALYLLVWKPREGQEQNELEGWLERIRLRVGERARVLLVATHATERQPELDYPALKARFGELLAGHYAVDNADNTGIPELKKQIATLASELEPVGVPFNPNWLAAREELLALDQSHIGYAGYRALCTRHGLGPTACAALLGLLHTLGYVIHHDLDGLRDFIVLQPEWLTKAISYVLEDKATRDAGGILHHDHLRALWQNPPANAENDVGAHRYDEAHFPYLLRLMEEFDVSVRVEGQERASLVPQLVPWERPELPWEPSQPGNQAQLRLLCEMEQDPPGLIAWATARNYRWNTGLHWRNGLFLRHEDGHEALIDYSRRRGGHLELTVRGSYPSHFIHLLQDGLQYLIRQRWPYLNYEFHVPCLTAGCEGRFPLQQLQEGRRRSRHQISCPYCWEEQDLGALLEGFVMPVAPVHEQLAAMEARLMEALKAQQENAEEIKRLLTESRQLTRRIMRALLDEARQGPRLFTLSPVEPHHRFDPRQLLQEPLQLTLWCEHPGREHPLPEPYRIQNPRKWVTRIAPYISITLQILRIAAPIASGVIGLAEKPVREQYEPAFNLMSSLIKAAGETKESLEAAQERIDHLEAPFNHALSRAEGEGLRAFHDLLNEVGWKPGALGLRRISDKKTGDVLWVCGEHYTEYDPGLPKV